MNNNDNLSNNTRKPNVIWSFFSSLKLTIGLLILIVFFSAVGSIIPQGDASFEFARNIPPGLAVALDKLQFFDLYHSIWFFLLLGLLSLNLLICSWNRFPVTWRAFKAKTIPDSLATIEDISSDVRLETIEKPDLALEKIENILAKSYRKIERKETDKAIFLHAERGRYSLFGVYLIHFSILLIIAGAIAGSVFGFKSFVKVAEGESVDTISLERNMGNKKLDFAVRCDRFSVTHYENGLPKEYRSDLTFLKNGNIVHSGALLVNHPITFEGIRFYQSSYGTIPGGNVTLGYAKSGGKRQTVNVKSGELFDLPEAGAKVRILRVEENLMQMGPAVKLNIRTDKQETQFWVFKEIEEIKMMNPGLLTYVPLFNPGRFAPYVFSLIQMERKYYTGLQVAYDPGVSIVAAGAFLLFFGFVAVFFTSHRQILIGIDKRGERARMIISGKASRDLSRLQREIEKIADLYKKSGVVV